MCYPRASTVPVGRTIGCVAQVEGAAMKDVEKLLSRPGLLSRLARVLMDRTERDQQARTSLELRKSFERQDHLIREVHALGQRLDSDVVKGFAALVERLDNLDKDVSRMRMSAQEHSQAVLQIVD